MGEIDGENNFCSRSCYDKSRSIGEKTYKKIGGRHEHRVVVENAIGRPLTSEEKVHHVDKNRHSNAIDNLALAPNQTIHMAMEHGHLDPTPYLVSNLVKNA